ncbi:pseudaminic acid synthase [Fusibacter sp. JL298sf-3]
MTKLYEKMATGVYMIAELSANHAGKLENALALVEAAQRAGADCVKIQTYTADTITIPSDKSYFKITGGLWDGYTLHDLYQKAYTPWEWHRAIKDKCDAVGVDFLSTPFDPTAVDFLEELGVDFYKVASFELVDIPLIEHIAAKGKPMIMSCGMASVEEIEEAVAACYKHGNKQVVLLKCCSQYPAKYEDMNLSVIPDMKARFGLPVGLSDHSMGHLAPVAAVALGAQVIEKHVKLEGASDDSLDAPFSMAMSAYGEMVAAVRDTVAIKGTPTYALKAGDRESLKGRRSLFAVKPIAAGEAFTAENVRSIRPSDGLKPKYYRTLLTKKAKRAYAYGDPIERFEIEE